MIHPDVDWKELYRSQTKLDRKELSSSAETAFSGGGSGCEKGGGVPLTGAALFQALADLARLGGVLRWPTVGT